MTDETKECPYCAETIKVAAIVCKHCGREFPKGERAPAPAHPELAGKNAVANELHETTSAQVVSKPKRRSSPWAYVVLGIILLLVVSRMGFYTVQPLEAVPDGITLLVWRSGEEPFFNSPDATCLRIHDGVSLMCRLLAFGQAPVERIIVRLPYMEWAYLVSTGGSTFVE